MGRKIDKIIAECQGMLKLGDVGSLILFWLICIYLKFPTIKKKFFKGSRPREQLAWVREDEKMWKQVQNSPYMTAK